MSSIAKNRSSRTSLFGSLSAAAILSAACVSVASGQSIANIGVTPGGTNSSVSGVSGDGTVVAATIDPFGNSSAHRWTNAGFTDLGSLPGSAPAYATSVEGVSRDGTALIGGTFYTDDTARAYRWTTSGGMQDLGLLDGGVAAVGTGLSGDGSVATGVAFDADFNAVAFRWTSTTGMQSLGTLPGGSSAMGNRVSADGSTIVGFSDTPEGTRAFRWTNGGGMTALALMDSGDTSANAFGINGDGSIIAGFSGSRPVVWINGVPQDLGVIPGDTNAIAYALSDDGSVVGGSRFIGFDPRATLWTASLGTVDLNSYLPTIGIDLTGWTLEYTRGVSFDGTTLVGEGTFNGTMRGWVVTIPTPGTASLLAFGGLMASRRRRNGR